MIGWTDIHTDAVRHMGKHRQTDSQIDKREMWVGRGRGQMWSDAAFQLFIVGVVNQL